MDWTRDSSRRDVAPGQIAVRFGGRALTHGELESKASRLAGGLLAAGIAPGDRVALFMPNCPELVIAYLACFAAGVIAVPLNTRYRAPEVGKLDRDLLAQRAAQRALTCHPGGGDDGRT